MGIYLNPGNEGFEESIHSKIYVDKTGLIACTNELLNTEEKFVCVSRPRRFGKSMALKMLAAYYGRGCDSRNLFAGLKIESDSTFEENLNKYDVIFLNMQHFLIRAKGQNVTDYLEQTVIKEIRELYGGLFSEQETSLATALEQIYAKTKKKFVFLIDEWDCVMRERQESEELQKQYLDFLRNLLKDQPFVALAYMTGILPVKKYGLHSALNMFWEYSMTDQGFFEEYTGFTETEVKELCNRFKMDFTQASHWYDGYQLTEFPHIYNPKSIVEAMRRHKFSNYWTSTETYDALKPYMDMDFDGLRTDIVQMLGGGRVRVNTRSFQNDMSVGGWTEVMRVLKASRRLLEDTLRQALEGYSGEILLVGVNYDKDDKNKPHQCIIEKNEKYLSLPKTCIIPQTIPTIRLTMTVMINSVPGAASMGVSLLFAAVSNFAYFIFGYPVVPLATIRGSYSTW